KWDVGMTATLEPVGGAPGDKLRSPRPDFPWFELNYADDAPADPALKTALRVVNRPGLVAPAWDVQAVRWDVNRGKESVRRPALTAYWVEGPPAAADTLTLDLGNVARFKPKESFVRGVKVEWLDVRFEDVPAGEV